uniref:Uncharacterized protein n=1 Tax=Polaromonas sp. H1N TaxID=1840283 RepID=A0A2S1FI63_9BURK|nr:hypothetical protein [Polaromonas sp. H1N]AWD72194.1 hypothetical protein pH1NP1_p017 [Polaromonas sp. H1N]
MQLAEEIIVRDTLKRYEAKLSEAVAGAWADWKALGLGGQLQFPGRSRACLVYDFFVKRAITAFSDDASVYVVLRDETAKFVFCNQTVLRFKKANDNGLGSNIQTQATLNFVDQQQNLFGLPDLHKVELVYRLNRLQTQIDEIVIAARDGNMCLWSYMLTPEMTAEIVPLPLAAAPEPARVKIKVKGADIGGQKKGSRD